MYSFEGEFRTKPTQSLRGGSRPTSRDELLRKAQQERNLREEHRQRLRSAVVIQAFIRGCISRKRLWVALREEFERARKQSELQSSKTQKCSDDINTLTALLVVFYNERIDSENLVWLCSATVKRNQLVFEALKTRPDLWELKLSRLFLICFRFISLCEETRMAAMPVRVLELFLKMTEVRRNMEEERAVKFVQTTMNTLVRLGFYRHMRLIVEKRFPPPMGSNQAPPTPFAKLMLELLLTPVYLCSTSSDAHFRTRVLQEVGEHFLCPHPSEQVQYCIQPALVDAVPLGLFLNALKPDLDGPLTVQPTLNFLAALLSILESNNMRNQILSEDDCIRYIDTLSDSVALLWTGVSDETLNLDEDAMDTDGEGEYPVADKSRVAARCVEVLNSPAHVLFLTECCRDRRCCVSVSRIVYSLLRHNRLAVYKYRLLYTLAFKPIYLQILWDYIVSISILNKLTSTETIVIQCLSRGIRIPRPDLNRFVPVLVSFCTLFSQFLITVDDAEFYGSPQSNTETLPALRPNSAMPFNLDELQQLCMSLRDLVVGLVEVAHPDTRHAVILQGEYSAALSQLESASDAGSSTVVLTDPASRSSASFRSQTDTEMKDILLVFKVSVKLLRQLYSRNTRRAFCPKNFWLSKQAHVALGLAVNFSSKQWQAGLMNMRTYSSSRSSMLLNRIADNFQQTDDDGPPLSVTELRALTILRELPFVVPFQDRVLIFQQLVVKDKADNQGEMINFLGGPQIQVMVRRNYIYEDAYDKLSIDNEPNLKRKLRVQLMNAAGMDEAGIDGGGISREFISECVKTSFDPNRGFFTQTHDHQLYPNPYVERLMDDSTSARHYFFIGRMLGKALYENMLVELGLADFFLSKILGQSDANLDMHYLHSLDHVLYKGLIYLKTYDGDVSELNLDFTVANNEFGETRVEELLPGGSTMTVTSDNRIKYIHLVADYKLNKQIKKQCNSFKQGLANVINLEWLSMFDYRELQTLISGARIPIDVYDLRLNTNYGGGYDETHPVIQHFWKTVENFTDIQKRQLLKFVTSCSRPPLLGFKELYPAFCIQNSGPDDDRLPTASTCMNLLKLPEFSDEERLKTKLIYAIEAGAGFELS